MEVSVNLMPTWSPLGREMVVVSFWISLTFNLNAATVFGVAESFPIVRVPMLE